MIKKISIFILGFSIIFTPFLIFATEKVSVCPEKQEKVVINGLVPVCNTIMDDKGNFCDPCGFDMALVLINNLIKEILFKFATPLFALIIIYAGWLYLTDQGSSEKKGKAKKIIKNALIGYVIALAAWLIVKAILWAVGYSGTSYLG